MPPRPPSVRVLRWLLAALPLLLLAPDARAYDENDFPYPRLGLYGSIRGWGYPLIDSSRAGPLNMEAIRTVARYHEVSAESDLFSLLEAGFGVGFLPVSTKGPESLKRTTIADMELERTVYLYGVAGRQRTAVAGALMKMLRAFDWSQAVAA